MSDGKFIHKIAGSFILKKPPYGDDHMLIEFIDLPQEIKLFSDTEMVKFTLQIYAGVSIILDEMNPERIHASNELITRINRDFIIIHIDNKYVDEIINYDIRFYI